jgi:NAD+ kinase
MDEGSFYEGAGFHEDGGVAAVSPRRVSSLLGGPEGSGSGGEALQEIVLGESSSLINAPDMYIIRTDGFTCAREAGTHTRSHFSST